MLTLRVLHYSPERLDTAMKHRMFRHYPWLALLAFAIGLVIILVFSTDGKVGLLGALIAGILGFCYFVQQQKLAETRLFEELFTRFNARYDALNDDLFRIRSATALSDKDPEKDKCILTDYLNLCAEEYLFFSLGYILPEAWTAWCRGMRDYLIVPHIAAFLREELNSGSYYGLSEEIIRTGSYYGLSEEIIRTGAE